MKLVFNWLGSLLIALSIGTTITLIVLLGMLWWKGALGDERVLDMLAALQGIKPPPPESSSGLDPSAEQPSIQDLLEARLRTSLDLDLRESAIDKSLGDLRTLETLLRTESSRLDDWKKSFDSRLAELQNAAADASLLEVQRTLEAIQPKQAKEQLMKVLEEPTSPRDNPLEDVVRIFKAMPLDKRRKILAEFKSPEEVEKLHDILRDLRLGGSDTELLRETRRQMQQEVQ
jgi:hypothetical protein